MEGNESPEKDKKKKEIDPNSPTANHSNDKRKIEEREIDTKKEESPNIKDNTKSQDTTAGSE